MVGRGQSPGGKGRREMQRKFSQVGIPVSLSSVTTSEAGDKGDEVPCAGRTQKTAGFQGFWAVPRPDARGRSCLRPGGPGLRDPGDPQGGHTQGFGRLRIQSFLSFCLFSGKMGSGISSSFWRVIWRVNHQGTRGCWSLSPSPWVHPDQCW